MVPNLCTDTHGHHKPRQGIVLSLRALEAHDYLQAQKFSRLWETLELMLV